MSSWCVAQNSVAGSRKTQLPFLVVRGIALVFVFVGGRGWCRKEKGRYTLHIKFSRALKIHHSWWLHLVTRQVAGLHLYDIRAKNPDIDKTTKLAQVGL